MIQQNIRSRFWPVILIGITVVQFHPGSHAQNTKRAVRGIIYFSNNTPPNFSDFPVQLLAENQKKIVAETRPTTSGEFFLDDISAGKYVLKITNPDKCTLLYRIDVRTRSIANIRVVMDAACAHTNGTLSDLPK
jgi:hypothetical protein